MSSLKLGDFDLGNDEEARLLHDRVRALNLVFSDLGRKIRKGRDVEIEVAVVAVTDSVGGPHAFRGDGDNAVTVVVISVTVTFVVTTFVSAKGLSGGEGFVANGALMGLTSGGGAGGGGGGSGGAGGLVFGGGGEFPVTGLVSTERLVRGEALVANGAFVTELGGRIWCRLWLWLWRWRADVAVVDGGGAAASEHDEAEGEVLFFRRMVARTL